MSQRLSPEHLTPYSHHSSRAYAPSSTATPTRAVRATRTTRGSGNTAGSAHHSSGDAKESEDEQLSVLASAIAASATAAVQGKRVARRRLAVYDRVNGQVMFPPVLRLFIDSPEVQRLRGLQQLGNSHYVYPSATHTRFEHSLGVAHLAIYFLKQILANHSDEPGLGLPLYASDGTQPMRKDMWCVGIAGLCHDLGHGPLSHMFEKYVNRVREREGKKEWSHEQASISMLESIWHRQREQLADFGLVDDDLEFVKLLINGLKAKQPWPTNVGRPSWKRFMTDLIANKVSGLDVDKLDYLQRDSQSCFGSPALLSLDRLFQGACAMRDPQTGRCQVCYEDKLSTTIEEVFEARQRQHRIVYQHRVTCVMDTMAIDAFMLADPYFLLTHQGKEYRLSECVEHPEVYIQTGDWVLHAILRTSGDALAPAREIVDRIVNRRIYTTIGTSVGTPECLQFDPDTMKEFVKNAELKQRLEEWERTHKLKAITTVETKFTKTSGDLKDRVDPLSVTGFFNPRHGANAELYYGARTQAASAASQSQGQPSSQTLIVLCRMPLSSEEDLNVLSEAFNSVSEQMPHDTATAKECTPVGAVAPTLGQAAPATAAAAAESYVTLSPATARRAVSMDRGTRVLTPGRQSGGVTLSQQPSAHSSLKRARADAAEGDEERARRSRSFSTPPRSQPARSAHSPGSYGEPLADDVSLSNLVLSQNDASRLGADEPEVRPPTITVSEQSDSQGKHKPTDRSPAAEVRYESEGEEDEETEEAIGMTLVPAPPLHKRKRRSRKGE